MENETETCVNCHDPTTDSDHEWYCSDACKRENESPLRSKPNDSYDEASPYEAGHGVY